MQDWSYSVIRVFGYFNLLFGMTGTVLILHGIPRSHDPGELPYVWFLFYLCTAINLLFLVALMLAGYWLVRLRRSGVILSNYVFSLEIIYWISTALGGLALTMSKHPTAIVIGQSLGTVGGTGDIGTALQFISAYPIIGLIGLNITRRRLDKKGFWTREAKLA
jgi:hypothetical protein